MSYDRTPCPQRGVLPCVRSFTDPICVTCRRDLPLTHPTSREQAAELFASDSIAQAVVQASAEGRLPPPPPSVRCPACGFEGASASRVVPGMSCPACGAVFRQLVTLRDPEGKLVAARRIKRALHAEADRVAGIDTSHLGGRGPMPAARIAWFREQAGRALSLREADELIEALPELLDELDRLRAPSAPADPAAPWQLASDIPDGPPLCPTCRKPMHRASFRSSSGSSGEGDVCLDCSGLREPLHGCAECGRLTQYELCSQCADPDEAGRV